LLSLLLTVLAAAGPLHLQQSPYTSELAHAGWCAAGQLPGSRAAVPFSPAPGALAMMNAVLSAASLIVDVLEQAYYAVTLLDDTK
jgi:hypothetical protein